MSEWVSVMDEWVVRVLLRYYSIKTLHELEREGWPCISSYSLNVQSTYTEYGITRVLHV